MVTVYFSDGTQKRVTAVVADTLIKSGKAQIKPYEGVNAVIEEPPAPILEEPPAPILEESPALIWKKEEPRPLIEED
jgi:hypothetical protein